MTKVIVISDDLTGANVTGALFKKNGYNFATFRNDLALDLSILKDYDAVAVSTDSRGINKTDAYKRVRKAALELPVDTESFYQKRIDSTLRGNIGTEIDALLDVLGEESAAFVCAAYPEVSKQVVGGYLLVEGEILERTGVSRDPKCPVVTSSVQQIIEKQAQHRVGIVSMDIIAAGECAIIEKIKELCKKGMRIISFDAVTNQDIDQIAKACFSCGKKFVSVDPGPLTLALLNQKKEKSDKREEKIFIAIGSVVPIVREQIEAFENYFGIQLIKIDVSELQNVEKREAEEKRVLELLEKCVETETIVGIVTSRSEEDILDLKQLANEYSCDVESICGRINQSIAEITKRMLERYPGKFRGLYTSGGDVTLGICQILGSVGFKVLDEIEPFTMYGELIGGRYEGLPIVTKGGLAGNVNTLKTAISCLQIKLKDRGEH